VIKDSENGTTIPANDAESLSKAILELLNDQALRVRLGKSARGTIRKDFTLQKELDANLQVYKQLGIQP
jgi:glycosyltransferase involved in cell wall biosynthesis